MIVHGPDNREIEISVYGKYSDDIQVDEAYYTEDDEEVTDEVIDWVMEAYATEIFDEWYQGKVGAAEDAYDAMMER